MKRIGPTHFEGEQRGENTGSRRTRTPRFPASLEGNSSKKHACPRKVTLREASGYRAVSAPK